MTTNYAPPASASGIYMMIDTPDGHAREVAVHDGLAALCRHQTRGLSVMLPDTRLVATPIPTGRPNHARGIGWSVTDNNVPTDISGPTAGAVLIEAAKRIGRTFPAADLVVGTNPADYPFAAMAGEELPEWWQHASAAPRGLQGDLE